jgi:Ca2+-binding RTX toxin-like protein
MGTIYGKHYFSTILMKWIDDFNDDPLPGTNDDDTIFGLGGHDKIWGGLGDDKMYGGTGNDEIKPALPGLDTTWNWGWDRAYGGPGNDTLDFSKTTGKAHLYGEGDNDTLKGGSNNDILDGGTGTDQLYGNDGSDHISTGGGGGVEWAEGGNGTDYIWGGDYIDYLFGNDSDDANDSIYELSDDDAANDYLYGEAGRDVLYGGAGHDVLDGGADRDFLFGNSGYDRFVFEIPNGWTDSKVSDPDHIMDFMGADDWLDMPVAGTAPPSMYEIGNYIEVQTGGLSAGYDAAQVWAENHITGNVRYAFVSDGVNGYLFGDLNGNGTVETGIVLEGVTSITQFDYSNIM